ncbi:MAG: CPXCG motif-containing cysteine-rich protein [Proteobacteria bacterium]|nr:CPXCG motif-containing cysteine-rich protein [Pseudomonadota bacterium]
MNSVETYSLQCPYCWEMIELTVDCSAGSQEYTEDCAVCCRPISVSIRIDADGNPGVEVKREDD